jgi:hypothetical protein
MATLYDYFWNYLCQATDHSKISTKKYLFAKDMLSTSNSVSIKGLEICDSEGNPIDAYDKAGNSIGNGNGGYTNNAKYTNVCTECAIHYLMEHTDFVGPIDWDNHREKVTKKTS